MQMKRYKVRATVTSHHLIAVQAVDQEAAKEAAKEKYAMGRLAQTAGHMEIDSCEHWPVEGLPND